MPDDSNTSVGSGVTPTPTPQPAMGTAVSGATPGQPTVTLEAALAQLEALKHEHENATGELKRHREKLTAFEKAQADADAAKLSDIEKATKLAEKYQTELAEAQKQLQSMRVERAAQKLGIADPHAATVLLASSGIEYDASDEKSLEKALKDLMERHAILKPASVEPPKPAPQVPPFNPARAAVTGANGAKPARTMAEAFRIHQQTQK